MGVGAVFLLLLVLVVIAAAAWLAFGGSLSVSGKRAQADDAPATSDDPEANARFERGERPDHTRVTDPGQQHFVDT